MMTSFGLNVSARAIATDCCWPPDNRPAICVTDVNARAEFRDHRRGFPLHALVIDRA